MWKYKDCVSKMSYFWNSFLLKSISVTCFQMLFLDLLLFMSPTSCSSETKTNRNLNITVYLLR